MYKATNVCLVEKRCFSFQKITHERVKLRETI